MKTKIIADDPPYFCYLGCGKKLNSKYSEKSKSWNWFTGYLDYTIHICPECWKNRKEAVDNLRQNAFVKSAPRKDE